MLELYVLQIRANTSRPISGLRVYGIVRSTYIPQSMMIIDHL